MFHLWRIKFIFKWEGYRLSVPHNFTIHLTSLDRPQGNMCRKIKTLLEKNQLGKTPFCVTNRFNRYFRTYIFDLYAYAA
jgi:hypothetical protein